VRFEADAYVNDDESDLPEMGISSAFEFLNLGSMSPISQPKSNNDVHVIRCGRLVPPHTIAEMKCTARPKLNISDIIPQLWISQTPYLFIGYHKDGHISQTVQRQEMSDKLAKWEVCNLSEHFIPFGGTCLGS